MLEDTLKELDSVTFVFHELLCICVIMWSVFGRSNLLFEADFPTRSTPKFVTFMCKYRGMGYELE